MSFFVKGRCTTNGGYQPVDNLYIVGQFLWITPARSSRSINTAYAGRALERIPTQSRPSCGNLIDFGVSGCVLNAFAPLRMN